MVLIIDNETFIIYVTILNTKIPNISLFWAAQIGLFKANKMSTINFAKYFGYTNVFLSELTIKLLEYININNHAIKLEKDKQLFYSSINSLGPVKLKILKIYIKTNLANGFIRHF